VDRVIALEPRAALCFGFDKLSESEGAMADLRLGDVIDDHCIKCRRITNHSIVSIINGDAAKVRCRTCYHDHDYRHEQAPPSKKDLKKQELFKEVLSTMAPAAPGDAPEADPPEEKKPKARSKKV
jgi:hypothetical protein